MGIDANEAERRIMMLENEVGNIKEYYPNSVNEIKETMKSQADEFKKLVGVINGLHTKVTVLEVKSGLWGLLGGAITVGIAVLLTYF